MSFETELKTNYAEAHRRLIYGKTSKPDIAPTFPPIAIRQVKSPPPEPQKTELIEPPSPISTVNKPTMWELLKWVSATEGVTVTELRGAKHSKRIYRVRFIFCYLARIYASMSLPQIGKFIGGRDHTTILNAINKIRIYRLSDAGLCQRVAYYEMILERHQGRSNSEIRCPHCGSVIPRHPH